LFQSLALRLIKEALDHGKGFPWTKVTFFGKELPHGVINMSPPLLSDTVAEEPMLHQLHLLHTAMGTTFTFINLRQDFFVPPIHRHCLVDNQPKKDNLFVPWLCTK
jgi:hypothetical protein